jgi:hypothetical protein
MKFHSGSTDPVKAPEVFGRVLRAAPAQGAVEPMMITNIVGRFQCSEATVGRSVSASQSLRSHGMTGACSQPIDMASAHVENLRASGP